MNTITATIDPFTGNLIITVSPEDSDALHERAGEPAYSGSDEWDLNEAWTSGYLAALDDLKVR